MHFLHVERYPTHQCVALSYDIMCAFNVTLAHSSIGVKACDAGLVGVVPSFHGYVHNHDCQLGWHLLYTDGVGLEDFRNVTGLFQNQMNLQQSHSLQPHITAIKEYMSSFLIMILTGM